jgi:predicted nucleic acid-binding protein
VSRLVIDASVAIKWVVEEAGTVDALALLQAGNLAAPDLLTAECVNILWKKVRRTELLRDEAIVAARLLQGADIEIFPTRQLLKTATAIAIDLDHPAYDCVYLALALDNRWRFATADEHLRRKLAQPHVSDRFKHVVLSLTEARQN